VKDYAAQAPYAPTAEILPAGNVSRGVSRAKPVFLEKNPIMPFPITSFSPYTSLFSFVIGLPTMIAAYYQSWKARQEARLAREGALFSMNCLEFVTGDGDCINLIPLETLHSLPKPGDVVLLPGDGVGGDARFAPGAYRIERIEHIYTPAEIKKKQPREARLTKAVALVSSLH
jgi:hypothetical protein